MGNQKLNILTAARDGKAIIHDPPGPGGPKPCSECGCPLFWCYLSAGPLYCAECLPPDKKRVKRWRMIVTINGQPRLIDKATEERAFRAYQETGILDFDAAVEDDIEIVNESPIPPGLTFDEWWESLKPATAEFFAKLKGAKKQQDAGPVFIPSGCKLWFINKDWKHTDNLKKVKLDELAYFCWEGGPWYPASRFPSNYLNSATKAKKRS